MRVQRGRLIVGAAVVVMAAVAAFFLLRRGTDDAEYATVAVDRGDVVDVVGATGTLQAVTTVQVGSQVSGTVQSLYADFNSAVRKGQVLARLDPSLFQARLGQAQAGLVAARANVERSRATVDDTRQKLARAQQLTAEGLLPQADLDAAKANYEGAVAQMKASQAAVTQAAANVRQAEVDMTHTVIKTPIDGVVVARNVDVGQTVAASLQAPVLFVIANDLRRMQVSASIDEADVGRVHTGQEATFRVDAYPNEVFTGRVEQVRLQPITAQNVVTYQTIIGVDNPGHRLMPGMTATVSVIVRKSTGVLRIPAAALRFRPEGFQGPGRGGAGGSASPGAPGGGGGRALKAIRRNKVRSALTMLGVIIGVGSVIAMIALGSGARASIDQQIESQGTNVIYVSSGSFGRGGGSVRGGAGTITTLTLEDAAAMAQIPSVARVSPMVRGRAQVVAGNQNWNTQMEGGNEEYTAIRNWVIQSGENFTARDVLLADKVCLLGATVAGILFPDTDPVGQIVRVKNLPFRVLGVLAPKGQGQFGQDQDDIILAPYTTLQKKLLGITHIHQVSVSAASSDAVEGAAVEITQLLRQRHRTSSPEEDDFTVRTVEEMAATRVEMANTMTMLLMSVASVSLLVGGIGIMNIMLVSVTERTREIGLRMAVGARTRDILRQFLTEAVGLSVVGGAAGVVLGLAVSRALTQWLSWPTLITPGAIVIAFAFAASVGVFFGYYPARKAASLDPIEALRYE